jgi:dienelactone hydrolase
MQQRELTIPTDTTVIPASLYLPATATGLVVVVQGPLTCQPGLAELLAAPSGSGGLAVMTAGVGAAVHDARTLHEQVRRDAMHVLTQRLVAVTRFLRRFRQTSELPLAYFGCGVGGGAVCAASVACARDVACLVTWEGRIDLVGHDLLRRVRVPALMMLGDHDSALLVDTRSARQHLGGEHVDGSAPLARACEYARAWLARHLHEASRARHAPLSH